MQQLRILVVAPVIALLGSLLAGGEVAAVGGEVDLTFGTLGAVRLDTTRPSIDVANAAVSNTYGEITVAGALGDRMMVTQFGRTGRPTFGIGGSTPLTFDFGVPAVASGVAAWSERFVAVGSAGSDLAVAALYRGEPDHRFGAAGRLVVPLGSPARGEAVSRDGLVAGWVEQGGDRDVLLVSLGPLGLGSGFGDGGPTRVLDLVPGEDDAAFAIELGSTSFYVAGNAGSAAVVLKFRYDGTLDPTFASGGMLRLDVTPGGDVARAIEYDSRTDRIFVAGQAGSGAFVAQITSAGHLVPGFRGGVLPFDFGGTSDVATGVHAHAGGGIIVAGTQASIAGSVGAVRRITDAGEVEEGYGVGGLATTPLGRSTGRVNAAAPLPGGGVVLVGDDGDDIVLAGLTGLGTADPEFGTGGHVVLDDGRTAEEDVSVVRLHRDGRIVTAGRARAAKSDVLITRHLPDGRPDPTFGVDGTVLAPGGWAVDIAVQPDDRLLVLIAQFDLGAVTGRLIRLLPDGRLDPSLGADGDGVGGAYRGMDIDSFALLRDGRIVVAVTGTFRNSAGVARFLPTGLPDPTFGVSGFVAFTSDSGAFTVGVQSDGDIVVVEAPRGLGPNVQLVTSDGKTSGWLNLWHHLVSVDSLVVTADDGVLLAGQTRCQACTGAQPPTSTTVLRLDSEGLLDRTFGSEGKLVLALGKWAQYLKDLVLDGPFVVAVLTAFDTIDGPMTTVLARSTLTGTFDTRYGSGGFVRLDADMAGGVRDDGGRIVLAGETLYPVRDLFITRVQPGPVTLPTTTTTTTSRPFVIVPPLLTTTTTTVTAPLAPRRVGYWLASRAGHVYAFGDAGHLGNASHADIVDIVPTPSGRGYWMAGADGTVHAFGDARHLGGMSAGQLRPDERVASLSATPSGAGYWLFTSKGRALPFGAAVARGDLVGTTLNGPILDSVATPSGLGYYLVASDGGIFAFGDARFRGSMGGRPLNAPVRSLVPDGDGTGYWLVASDGGVFAFDALFRGSAGGMRLNRPVAGMVCLGNGYVMVGEDGGLFNFSDRPFLGSLGASPPASPVVAVAVLDLP